MKCQARPPRAWKVKGAWVCVLQEHKKAVDHQFRLPGQTRRGDDE